MTEIGILASNDSKRIQLKIGKQECFFENLVEALTAKMNSNGVSASHKGLRHRLLENKLDHRDHISLNSRLSKLDELIKNVLKSL
jgi:hypothetical protein